MTVLKRKEVIKVARLSTVNEFLTVYALLTNDPEKVQIPQGLREEYEKMVGLGVCDRAVEIIRSKLEQNVPLTTLQSVFFGDNREYIDPR